jgi:hypothetical protein
MRNQSQPPCNERRVSIGAKRVDLAAAALEANGAATPGPAKDRFSTVSIRRVTARHGVGSVEAKAGRVARSVTGGRGRPIRRVARALLTAGSPGG